MCPTGIVLGRYLIMAGMLRFAIEFVRVNVRVLGPLTLAHLGSLILILVGTWLLLSGPRLAIRQATR